MTDDPYVYPGTSVLINKYDIRNAEELERTERELVAERLRQMQRDIDDAMPAIRPATKRTALNFTTLTSLH